MRFIAELTARADAVYDNTYHHKLRGRMWRALEEFSDAEITALHVIETVLDVDDVEAADDSMLSGKNGRQRGF